jgi:hypothetical protein
MQVASHGHEAEAGLFAAHDRSMINGLVSEVEIAGTISATLMAEAAFENARKLLARVGMFEHPSTGGGTKKECTRFPGSREQDGPQTNSRRNTPGFAETAALQDFGQIGVGLVDLGDGALATLCFRECIDAGHDVIEQTGRHRCRRGVLDGSPRKLFDSADKAPAAGALRRMHCDNKMLGFVERAGRKAGKKVFRRVVRDRHVSSSNRSRRRLIANLILDFTVPSGIPKAAAISV